jgi:DNA-binding NarL/FixJ family response regulator
MKRLRLLLVDDQAMFREGLRTLLEVQPDFEIVGEAADGDEAVAQSIRLRPDIVLMDLRLPVVNGIEATRRIAQSGAPARVIVLTTFEEDVEIFAALRAGAVGYLLKTSPSEKLCAAIRLASRGESWLEPSVAAKVVMEFARLGTGSSPAPAVVAALKETLSARETDVLRLLASGKSNKEIASELVLAEGTVKNHLSNVFGKLGVLDRTQAALRGRDLGLI